MDRLEELIKDLVSRAEAALLRDGPNIKRGVLLKQTRQREEVYQAFLDAGFVSVFREGVDEPRLSYLDSDYYVIDLDDYFDLWGV